MTKINGAYVFFGLFVVVIIGLWVTGNLFTIKKPVELPKTESTTEGGKRKRKLRRKQRLR